MSIHMTQDLNKMLASEYFLQWFDDVARGNSVQICYALMVESAQ